MEASFTTISSGSGSGSGTGGHSNGLGKLLSKSLSVKRKRNKSKSKTADGADSLEPDDAVRGRRLSTNSRSQHSTDEGSSVNTRDEDTDGRSFGSYESGGLEGEKDSTG